MAQTSKKATEKKDTISPELVSDTQDASTELNQYDVIAALLNAFSGESDEVKKQDFYKAFTTYLKQEVEKFKCLSKYNLVVLYDDSTMLKSDADKIYSAVTTFDKKKPLLMILLSGGGIAGSAYLIGKLCREYSNGKFIVVVPRYAKSAATLLCCAANEIHMGSLSELGPIDPQINGLPALGLKNSIVHIAELVKESPTSAEMFAKYLHLSIEPIQIGYYERVAESAMQYAENLLSTHKEDLPKDPQVIANELVYKYKDHGFVIDKSEAIKILGEKIIKHNSEEYELGNTVYQFLQSVNRFASLLKYSFYFIGGIDSHPTLTKQNNK